MSVRRKTAGAVVAIMVSIAACSSPVAEVSDGALRAIVERDGIAFNEASIPEAVLDRLAEHDVVLLGETHHLREHWALVAALASDLHDRGFRQLLIEAPHMASWLLDDYVQGSPLAPEWEVPPFYERRLSAIRMLNETLPRGDRVHVRGIDANEEWYGGARDFHLLFGWVVDLLPGSGPLDPFLGMDYAQASASAKTQAVEAALRSLEADRVSLRGAWGVENYEHVAEMLEVELASVDIRATRNDDDNDGARAREQVIKHLAEDRINECACRTLINIGGHHAQKSHLMGTDQEWMGDYLAHTSEVVNGSIFVVELSSAKTSLEPGAGGTPWDILDSKSPANELLRVMAETWPDENVFLPLDDALFADRTVAFNSEDVIYITALKNQFDAVIQYGSANRMPVD